MRWLSIAFLGLLAGLAAAADNKPAATMQMHSPAKLLREIREAANIVAGETGRKAFDDLLRDALGEKGLQGLDLNKPLLGYAVFDKTDVDKTTFIVLVPITKEADFFELLKRAKLDPSEIEGQKGIWKLAHFNFPQDDKEIPVDVTMRIIEKIAYIGFNAAPELLDPLKVHTPDQVYDPNEAALFSYRQFNDRIPESVLKGNFKYLDGLLTKIKQDMPDDATAKVVFQSIEKLFKNISEMSLQSKETGTRILLDTSTGEVTVDAYYVPKPGSLFAKVVGMRKPPVNAFGRLADDSLAAGVFIQMPVGLKELQEMMTVGLKHAQDELAKEEHAPAYVKEIGAEALAGLARTVNSGDWDIAVTLNGPDKDGKFTVAAATSFDDARPLEKLLRKHQKSFPADVRDLITFDADKIGDLAIHTIEFEQDTKAMAEKLFGESKVNLVFGPQGIYAAIGPSAKDMLKTAIACKPKATKPFDIQMNPKRIGQFYALIDPDIADKAAQVLGNEDYSYSALSFNVSGGDALRFNMNMNLKVLPRMLYRIGEMDR